MLKKTILLLCVGLTSIFAQQKDSLALSGNFYLDNQISFNSTFKGDDGAVSASVDKKNPLLAGVFSFIVPGAGEFYAESYWKSALFIAIEAAAITTNIIYNGHGDDQTGRFEDYANGHWSAARYALWTITNLDFLNPGLSRDDYAGLFLNAEKTQVDWSVLNKMERDIGTYYSHSLDQFGEQQYYEMIGKYRQFVPGWDDFGDENTPYVFGDPVSPNFTYYAGERAKANDFYNVARTALIVVVTNHIVSAIDAALTASAYNHKIEAKVGLDSRNIGFYTEHTPRLDLKFNF